MFMLLFYLIVCILLIGLQIVNNVAFSITSYSYLNSSFSESVRLQYPAKRQRQNSKVR